MVIDTSAIIEIFIDGPAAAQLKAAMKAARGHRFMSAATLVEAHVVVRRRYVQAQDRSRQLLDRMIASYDVAIEAVQEAHAYAAIDAYSQIRQRYWRWFAELRRLFCVRSRKVQK
jgi:uncharacterized protein with PIN domain